MTSRTHTPEDVQKIMKPWVGLTNQEMLDFIEEFMGSEQERHPMFSEGYDLALYHMKKLIEGDKHEL
jgi:hypothetical protein